VNAPKVIGFQPSRLSQKSGVGSLRQAWLFCQRFMGIRTLDTRKKPHVKQRLLQSKKAGSHECGEYSLDRHKQKPDYESDF
jgi:hypothetical protein